MCQPGLPSPHGDGHAGSPGLANFHIAKSSGSRFSSPGAIRDILGRARLAIGVENVQAVHRPLETREIFVDDDVPRHAAFSPFRNAAVVDVGYVAHEVDPVPKMDEIAAQDVEEHERAGVAEMRFGGWSQTAHVNAYGVPRERSERFDRPRARII